MEDTAQTSSVHSEHFPSITTSRIVSMLSHCKIDRPSLEYLPPNLIHFMKSRGLDISELAAPIPRYIRIKPKHNIQFQTLYQQLHISDKEILRIDQNFFALNPNTKISHSSLYQNGLIYGMDYSSAIPVRCLDLQQGLHILELCSAPGNKSMLMADSFDNIKIKGVQISHNRANIMRNLIKKYKLDHKIEVIQADGLTFKSQVLFDRVLVDAQCTHQGSLKHIFKFVQATVKPSQEKEKHFTKQQLKQFKQNNTNPYTSTIQKSNEWSIADFQQRFLDAFKLANLKSLQRGLLDNGFSLLQTNGILVYSTCSFDQEQNQGIIAQFLSQYHNAELIDAGKDLNCSVAWKQGSIKGTLRFSPSISYCGGMFVAKLKKLSP